MEALGKDVLELVQSTGPGSLGQLDQACTAVKRRRAKSLHPSSCLEAKERDCTAA